MPKMSREKHRIAKRTHRSTNCQPKPNLNAVQRQSLRVAIRESLATALNQSTDTNPANATYAAASTDKVAPELRGTSLSCGRLEISTPDSQQHQYRPDYPYGIPSGRAGWYKIRGIIAQRLNYYLVDWEGVDPATGKDWPVEFVHFSDVSSAALQAWHALERTEKLRRDKKGTIMMEDADHTHRYDEAWQRSLKACKGVRLESSELGNQNLQTDGATTQMSI